MPTLRQAALSIAAELPKGDPTRRKLLAALQRGARVRDYEAEREEWKAKTNPRVKATIDKALAGVEKAMQTASKKAKVPVADIKKLDQRDFAIHPNKAAFDYLFPRERRFGFTNLDFGTFPEGAVSNEELARYHALANGLARIEQQWDKIRAQVAQTRKRFKHPIDYNNLPLWDDEPYTSLLTRFRGW